MPFFGLDVSYVSKINEGYKVCFCRKFCVNSIKKQKEGFSLPFSIYGEKKYKNIFVFEKELYLKILNSIDNNIIVDKECDVEFSIVEVLRLKSKKRIANVVVNFNGLNIIFGVIKKKENFFIFPPKEFEFIDKSYGNAFFRYIIDLCKEEKL